ncbi:MAG TPA: DNA replication/repair protein RecF [Steroidobacteraceae bacterium]|nr:DNA replication/repair protein RecF [Steroidobacteraceae bacterium]
MGLCRVGVQDFRCIANADLVVDSRCNLISGNNASGKTSLLEAIFFLGRGRSFRTTRNEALLRNGSSRLTVTGRLKKGETSYPLGVSCDRAGISARYASRSLSGLAELATLLPVQAIDPDVHQVVEGGPQERRRFLDWGVFHVEPSFVDDWRRYQRALRQRNAALRLGLERSVVRAWDAEFIEAGNHVSERRTAYLELLRPFVQEAGERLLGSRLDLVLHKGWKESRSLEEALNEFWMRDLERRSTQVGPHRADLGIELEGRPVRGHVSRGQQKLVAAAMLLGQLRCDAESGSPLAVLLVDDPAAELDSGNLDRLLQEVIELPAQLFVTALDGGHPALSSLPSGARFHVEHGVISALV